MFKSENKIGNLLKLDRPLVVFDVEATGPAFSQDKILALAYIKIFPGKKIALSDEMIINPETEIPAEATQVHGISEADVKGKPTFREVAQKIFDVFHNCYYGGYSITNFDLPILKREFLRVGLEFNYRYEDIIDSKVVFSYLEPRNLSFAYKYYCGKSDIERKGTIGKARAMLEIFNRQLKKHEEIRNLDFIRKIHKAKSDRFVDNTVKFYWQGGETYLAFGKHKNQPLSQVVVDDPAYLKWILEADFSEETKNIVAEALNGKPKRKRKTKAKSKPASTAIIPIL